MAETPGSYVEYLEMDLDDLMKLAGDQLKKRKPTVGGVANRVRTQYVKIFRGTDCPGSPFNI